MWFPEKAGPILSVGPRLGVKLGLSSQFRGCHCPPTEEGQAANPVRGGSTLST